MFDKILPLAFVVVVVAGCTFAMFKRPKTDKDNKKTKTNED